MTNKRILHGRVLNTYINSINWNDVLSIVSEWVKRRDSRYICLCNAHSVVTADRDLNFRAVINTADLALPDGAPVAWMLRRFGYFSQHRMPGPELMWRCCEAAARHGYSVFLFGSSEQTLLELQNQLCSAFPNLKVAGAYSPPFRPLTPDEDTYTVEAINNSGANIVFVSLGCPKQEHWMAAHRGRIRAVMIGVGAAFDWHAGLMKRAPDWMQRCGLEWLYRLISEPRRLWRRYMLTNSLFIVGALKQLLINERKR